MTNEEIKTIADSYYAGKADWLNKEQEQDTKVGWRQGFACALRRFAVRLAECERRERAAFVAGYKYIRERSEEMKKYSFDEAARITANEEYWRWKKDNDR